jgi:hypothetical protein
MHACTTLRFWWLVNVLVNVERALGMLSSYLSEHSLKSRNFKDVKRKHWMWKQEVTADKSWHFSPTLNMTQIYMNACYLHSANTKKRRSCDHAIWAAQTAWHLSHCLGQAQMTWDPRCSTCTYGYWFSFTNKTGYMAMARKTRSHIPTTRASPFLEVIFTHVCFHCSMSQ